MRILKKKIKTLLFHDVEYFNIPRDFSLYWWNVNSDWQLSFRVKIIIKSIYGNKRVYFPLLKK